MVCAWPDKVLAFGGRVIGWGRAWDAAWIPFLSSFPLSRHLWHWEPRWISRNFSCLWFWAPQQLLGNYTCRKSGYLYFVVVVVVVLLKESKHNKLLLSATPLSQLPSISHGPWIKSLSIDRSTQSTTRFFGSAKKTTSHFS